MRAAGYCVVLAILLQIIVVQCNYQKDDFKDEQIKKIDALKNRFSYYISNNRRLALSSARWRIIESQKINYPNGEAEGCLGVSIALEGIGLYDSAITYNLKALEIWKNTNAEANFIRTYVSLARNYSKIRQYTMQRHYLKKALELINKSTDTLNRVQVCSELGIYYSNMQQYDSSKIIFRNALYFSHLISNLYSEAICINNYANILNQLNENDSAIIYYHRCIPYFQANKHIVILSNIYNNIALIYWDQNQRDSTLFYLEKGYKETQKFKNIESLEVYLSNMIDYWEEEPDLKKYNDYLHELLDLKDSVFKNNLEEKIANIEKDYTVKLKNEENEKLKSEIKRKNTIRNAAIILALLLFLLAFYQYRIYKQKRNIAEKETRLKENEIDQLLQERELKNMDALLEGRETERKRIGRDLHDRLGSILSTVKLHFSAIDERIDSLKKDNQIQYHKASALLDEAVGEVRKIAQDLVSGVLVKYGLTAALNDMKNTLEATGKITINLFEAGTGERQNLEFEIAIYRMVQELMSNILKHAEATKVDIHITKNAHQFTLMVEDNGKGFNPENPEKFGMGMANIKQRVAALGGVVNFDSKPGAGATVIIEIELEEKNKNL
jgi:signal transduction histidine kinase